MNENDKILLVKYITRQATKEEADMVKYLINNSKDHEELYISLYEAWQKSVYFNTGMIDTEKAYSAFLADNIAPRDRPVRFMNWKRIVAAAVFLLICSFGLYLYRQQLVEATEDHSLVQQQEISVPKGATLQTVLSDGTKVWINAGSTLKFDPDFGKKSRTVYLSGEAYFDIAASAVPFIVKTRHHTIRDIGTIFNVKAYSDDLSFETTVIEGEVSIEGKLLINSDQPQTVSVKEQQVLKLNYAPVETGDPQPAKKLSESEIVEVKVQKISSAQVEVYTGWTEDLLVFEGKTLQEIAKIMERRYDVEIFLKDMKMRNYEYTGSFKNIDDVEMALKILRETTDINYEINGRIITIRENKI
jgi:transmembrane sensor